MDGPVPFCKRQTPTCSCGLPLKDDMRLRDPPPHLTIRARGVTAMGDAITSLWPQNVRAAQ